MMMMMFITMHLAMYLQPVLHVNRLFQRCNSEHLVFLAPAPRDITLTRLRYVPLPHQWYRRVTNHSAGRELWKPVGVRLQVCRHRLVRYGIITDTRVTAVSHRFILVQIVEPALSVMLLYTHTNKERGRERRYNWKRWRQGECARMVLELTILVPRAG